MAHRGWRDFRCQKFLLPEGDESGNIYNGDLQVNPIDIMKNGGTKSTKYLSLIHIWSIDTSTAKSVPNGHPVDTFKQENRALEERIKRCLLYTSLEGAPSGVVLISSGLS